MAPVRFTHTVLKRRVCFEGELAYVELKPGAVAVLRRDHLYMIAERWPTGSLRFDHNGKGRRYVRLGWANGGDERLSVARIILALIGEGEQSRREAHYRNGDSLDLRPENLILGGRGRVRSDDRTHQETARRGWRISQGRSPDEGTDAGGSDDER